MTRSWLLLATAVLLCASAVASVRVLSSSDVDQISPATAASSPLVGASNDPWKVILVVSIGAVVGVILVTIGYRIFLLSLFILTYLIISIPLDYILTRYSSLNFELQMVVSGITAAVLAGIALYFWKHTLVVYGVAAGFLEAGIIISSPLYPHLSSTGAFYGLTGGLVAFEAVMAILMQRHSMIFGTSALGSLGIVAVIDYNLQTGFIAALLSFVSLFFQLPQNNLTLFGFTLSPLFIGWPSELTRTPQLYYLFAGWALMTLLFHLLQHFVIAKSFDHKPPFRYSYFLDPPEDQQPLLATERSFRSSTTPLHDPDQELRNLNPTINGGRAHTKPVNSRSANFYVEL